MRWVIQHGICRHLIRNEPFLYFSKVHLIAGCQNDQLKKSNKISTFRSTSFGFVNYTYSYCSKKYDFVFHFHKTGHRFISKSFIIYQPRSGKHSKLEETVHDLKEKAKEKMIEYPPTEKKKEKKPIMQRIKDELLHYYYGFKLLYVNTKICSKFMFKILRGKTLTRREKNLLSTTLGDLFRLVPFSVFIVVPFLEFTLPFFLHFFPGMLPSTFETKSQKETKLKKKFQVQLEMASFLQNTLQNMAVGGKGHESEEAAKFAEFFEKVRSSGGVVTSDEVMKFSKMFRDEITLDYLSRAQLKALCRVLGIKTIGTTKFLRFQLGLKLRNLQADDKLIHKEGINSLSVDELQMACQARGMPAWGVSEERLKQQLEQWLTLSVEKEVPPSLLLLSQAFMFPSNTPTEEKLAATIQSLPQSVVTATQSEIEVVEGKIDNKRRLDVLQRKLEQISKELQEIEEEKKMKKADEVIKSDVLDEGKGKHEKKADVLPGESKVQPDEEVIKCADIQALKKVMSSKLALEKERLAEIMHDMEDYEKDSKELEQMVKTLHDADVKESTAAILLKKKIKKIIGELQEKLTEMESPDGVKRKQTQMAKKEVVKSPRTEKIKVSEFVEALKTLSGQDNTLNHERLVDIVHRLDKNNDGYVSADLVAKMIDILSYEDVTLTKQQINELIDLLDKEEILEIDHQILKALTKDDAVSELRKEIEIRRAEIIEELKKEKKELDLKRKEEEKNKMKG